MQPDPVERVGERRRGRVVAVVVGLDRRVSSSGSPSPCPSSPPNPIAIECNDAIVAFATAPDAVSIRPPGRGLGRSFRRLFAVLTAPTDARDWVALTDAALPVDALHAWATTPRRAPS